MDAIEAAGMAHRLQPRGLEHLRDLLVNFLPQRFALAEITHVIRDPAALATHPGLGSPLYGTFAYSGGAMTCRCMRHCTIRKLERRLAV